MGNQEERYFSPDGEKANGIKVKIWLRRTHTSAVKDEVSFSPLLFLILPHIETFPRDCRQTM